MRIALVSDIHGNLIALDAVLADAARAGVDRIVCLGDIVDLGPRPAETVARLREVGAECITGNHDPLDENPPIPWLLDVEVWTRDVLSDDDRVFLDGLPPSMRIDVDGLDLLCVHGSPRSATDNILCDTPEDVLDAMIGDVAFDAMAGGHTHVQMIRRRGAQMLINVGSAGTPFAEPIDRGSPLVLPWAEYAIVTHAAGALQVDLRRVPFDIQAFHAVVRASTMPHQERFLSHWV